MKLVIFNIWIGQREGWCFSYEFSWANLFQARSLICMLWIDPERKKHIDSESLFILWNCFLYKWSIAKLDCKNLKPFRHRYYDLRNDYINYKPTNLSGTGFMQLISKISNKYDKLVLMGDFNMTMSNPILSQFWICLHFHL